MNIDKKIKQAFDENTKQVDDLIAQDEGLFSLIGDSFKGSLKRWVWIVNIVTLIASAVLVWCGYEFFTASQIQNQLYWGVCLIISLQAQIALKQWLFQEIYRNNIMREVKRLEIAIMNNKAS